MSAEQMSFPVRQAGEPVQEAGWYLAFGYGTRPLVLYAARGLTVWRDGMRAIPVKSYAGPIPEVR
jgi:hypothetical protein